MTNPILNVDLLKLYDKLSLRNLINPINVPKGQTVCKKLKNPIDIRDKRPIVMLKAKQFLMSIA